MDEKAASEGVLFHNTHLPLRLRLTTGIATQATLQAPIELAHELRYCSHAISAHSSPGGDSMTCESMYLDRLPHPALLLSREVPDPTAANDSSLETLGASASGPE